MATLAVSLTICGINYKTEMEGTRLRDFLLGFKWVTPFLVQTSDVGGHTRLIWILR